MKKQLYDNVLHEYVMGMIRYNKEEEVKLQAARTPVKKKSGLKGLWDRVLRYFTNGK
ncbi:MAG TPA: hypothetical protein VF622_01090 [Segetibacter sp.]|jgi:hypothetical protein